MILKARSLSSRCLLIVFLVSALFLACRCLPFHCVFTWVHRYRENDLFSFLFLWGHQPYWTGPTLMVSLNFNHLLKTLSENAVTLGSRASTYEVWAGGTIQSIGNMMISYSMTRFINNSFHSANTVRVTFPIAKFLEGISISYHSTCFTLIWTTEQLLKELIYFL